MAWTNKKRIKIARGTHSAILNSMATQAEGQLAYDEDTHYLTVGTLDKSGNEKPIKNNVPIRVRTVEGYFSDTETFDEENRKNDTYEPTSGTPPYGHYSIYATKEGLTGTLNIEAKGSLSPLLGSGINIFGENGITLKTDGNALANSITLNSGSASLNITSSNLLLSSGILNSKVPVQISSTDNNGTLTVLGTNTTSFGVDNYTNKLSSQGGLTFSRSGARWGSKTYDVSLYSDVNTVDGNAYLCTTNSPTDSSNDNTLATTAFVQSLLNISYAEYGGTPSGHNYAVFKLGQFCIVAGTALAAYQTTTTLTWGDTSPFYDDDVTHEGPTVVVCGYTYGTTSAKPNDGVYVAGITKPNEFIVYNSVSSGGAVTRVNYIAFGKAK